ncbi:NAD(P)/FAD-dependent oxidoreductase [Dongia soli]|uniref:NAD(P)/FAD-dependent oxidoreductase n=1 Tax=Dongia soli TaxID=600628 RepID=A0ABU5EF78_9PROT|nr:NAD(P)/FAD-dependent oxidoreductase [Dongia soli]
MVSTHQTARLAQEPAGDFRIVIVGGGAGGLELATKLGERLGRRGLARIILVDANPTHLWKPLLHEVAAGTLNSYQDELGYLGHAKHHGYRFQFGRMEGLDRARRQIILAAMTDDKGEEVVGRRRLDYDLLVLAVGSISNDFGTPGVREHARFLDSRLEAEILHRDLLILLAGRVDGATPDAGPDQDSQTAPGGIPSIGVAIVGGGATGVELAAELHQAMEDLSRYAAPVKAGTLQITVLEAADRILSPLPERLAFNVSEALRHLNIAVLTKAKVASMDAESVHLADGRTIPAKIKVWAAGIKAPAFLREIDGLESHRNGQLLVRSTLQTTRDDAIFAFGDCAWCPQSPGSDLPVPARAQAAHQEAELLAKSLVRHVEALHACRQPPPLPTYSYSDFGSLISLSRYTAAGTLMGGVFRKSYLIEGWFARLAYISLYRMHQMALHGIWRTLILILTNRLQRMTQPSLKMH